MAVGKQECQVVRQPLVDPLIAIAGPSHHVAPPLMRHFMKWNQVVEMFLAGFGEAGALLGIGWKERVCGKIQKPRPTLPKTPEHLKTASLLQTNHPPNIPA